MIGHPKKSFRNFILLWSGELISAIGSGLTSFGLSVYVFHLTGSASAMALVTLLAFMPALLLSPIAGVLADRYDRRLLMILGDGFSATGLLYILFCMTSGGAALWQICIGVTISSAFFFPDGTRLQSHSDGSADPCTVYKGKRPCRDCRLSKIFVFANVCGAFAGGFGHQAAVTLAAH